MSNVARRGAYMQGDEVVERGRVGLRPPVESAYYARVDPHHAFRNPFVFLLHSNVDWLYAKW
jgi:hypothetical protein